MTTIFEGLKVLDFSEGMAGSLATMVLADNGAEVVKVERANGDPYRSQPAWIMWNRGKKSVVLNLASRQDREIAQRLAQQSDVLVHNFRYGEADGLGIGYETLSRVNPRLIHCAVTALGSKGPYCRLKPYSALAEAKSGGFLRGGEAPTYRVRPRGDLGSAMMLVQGVAAALRVRDMTGLGQRLETTHFAGVVFVDSQGAVLRQAELGILTTDAERLNARKRRTQIGVALTYLNVRCKDGRWLQLANNGDKLFLNFIRVVGLDWITTDARFKGAPRNFACRVDALELRRIIFAKMQEKTLDEWLAILKKGDVAADGYLTTQQAMDHPYVAAFQGVVEIDDPHVGKTKQIGPLIQFSKTPSIISRPAPRLGEHTSAVLGSLPALMSRAGSVTPGKRSALPAHPLAGMLLLDFATWNAAPQGASLIADLGARVIKIEPPNAPDDARNVNMGLGRTLQGKESLAIDLKSAEGRRILQPLLAKADAILHNMRGNTPTRLGIDYASVIKLNPDVVYLYAGSYGSKGSGAGRPAFHPTAGSLSGGALWQLGKGNAPPPCDAPLTTEQIEKYSEELMAANESLPDQTGALGVGTALAMALYHKARTGEGQYLETTMLMSNLYLCSDDFIRYQGKPERPEPDQTLRGLHALHRLYATREGWIFLTCPLEEEWQALCQAIGQPGLATDPRFATSELRLRHDDWLVAILWPVFRERTADDWEQYLAQHDVPCARADGKRYEDFLLTDAGLAEAGLVVDVSHSTTGSLKRVSAAVEFSLTPGRAGPPHLFGEDTPSILAELGVSKAEIADLRAKGIVKWEEPVRGREPGGTN